MIAQESKFDRVCRTGLCTGSSELTIFHRAPLRFGFVLRLVNALDTERAFLHDTATANCDIRVELVVQWINSLALYFVGMECVNCVIAPVELTHLIRTVVGTVASPNAAVVHLQVELLRLAVPR